MPLEGRPQLAYQLGDDQRRADAIEVLSLRDSREAAPELLRLVKDSNPDVRASAWRALANLASESDLEETPQQRFLMHV